MLSEFKIRGKVKLFRKIIHKTNIRMNFLFQVHNLVIKSFIFFSNQSLNLISYIGSIAMAKNNLTRPLGFLKKHQKNAIKQ